MLHRKILKQNYLCVCVRARARTLKRLKSNDSKEKTYHRAFLPKSSMEVQMAEKL